MTYKANTLTWDAENRMTSFGSLLSGGYRAAGLRAWKQTSAGRTYYLYDGEKPVLEENNVGAKTAVATFGPNGLLARTDATRTLLYTFDPMGNLSQQVVAGTGVTVATYLFDSFGNRQVTSTDASAKTSHWVN